MDIDSEEPPDLVDLSARDEMPVRSSSPIPPTAELEDLALSTVPLTIITGYLGSGKTTLVNYLLNAQHGKKIAVILNEFGDSTPIERRAISISQTDRSSSIDFLTLGNGCICCSVKDAGLNAIEQLLARHQTQPFDSIVLETSGLADPGGIIPNFWTDEGLGSSVRLDGVVTVVDASNLLRSLDEPTGDELASATQLEPRSEASNPNFGKGEQRRETVAHLQLTTADSILLNKTDLLATTPHKLSAVTTRIRSINSAATITPTTYGRVPHLEGIVTDLHAYSTFRPQPAPHSDLPPQRHHSHLDPTISTLSLPLPALSQSQLQGLEKWLQQVLWENELPLGSTEQEGGGGGGGGEAFQIHRVKALFPLAYPPGGERMVQGVREVFEITEPAPLPSVESSASGGSETGSLVLIGKGLSDRSRWERSLQYALDLGK